MVMGLNWDGWSLDRILILFTGLVFLVIFVQVTLFHYRQNFHHWAMWIPVVATPVIGTSMVVFTFYKAGWLFTLVAVLLAAGALAGVLGSVLHVRGVGERVGGYELRNFLIGPPLTLPGMVTAMSIIGLIALYWG